MRRWAAGSAHLVSGTLDVGSRRGPGLPFRKSDSQIPSGSNVTLNDWSRYVKSRTSSTGVGQNRTRANRTMKTLALVGPTETEGFPHIEWRTDTNKPWTVVQHGEKELDRELKQAQYWKESQDETELIVSSALDLDGRAEIVDLEHFEILMKALASCNRDVAAQEFAMLDSEALLELGAERLAALLSEFGQFSRSIRTIDEQCMSLIGHYWRCLRMLPERVIEDKIWAFQDLIDTLLRAGSKSQQALDTASRVLSLLERKGALLSEDRLASFVGRIHHLAGSSAVIRIIEEVINQDKRASYTTLLNIALKARFLHDQPVFRPILHDVTHEYTRHHSKFDEATFALLLTRYSVLRDDRQFKETLAYMDASDVRPLLLTFRALLHPKSPSKDDPETIQAVLTSLAESRITLDAPTANLLLSALIQTGLVDGTNAILQQFRGLDEENLADTLGITEPTVPIFLSRSNRVMHRMDPGICAALRSNVHLLKSRYVDAEVVRRLDNYAQTLKVIRYDKIESALQDPFAHRRAITMQSVEQSCDKVKMLRQISERISAFGSEDLEDLLTETSCSLIEILLRCLQYRFKKKGFQGWMEEIINEKTNATFGSPLPFELLPLQAYPWLIRIALQISSNVEFGLAFMRELTQALDPALYSRVLAKCWSHIIAFRLDDLDREMAMQTIEYATEALVVRGHIDPIALIHLWLPFLKFLANSRETSHFFEAWDLLSHQLPELKIDLQDDGTAILVGRAEAIGRELAHRASAFETPFEMYSELGQYPWTLWTTLFKALAQMKPYGDNSILEIISALDLLSFEPFDRRKISWIFSDLLEAHARMGDVQGLFSAIESFSQKLDQARGVVWSRHEAQSLKSMDKDGNELGEYSFGHMNGTDRTPEAPQAMPFIHRSTLNLIEKLFNSETELGRCTAEEARSWYKRIHRLQRKGLELCNDTNVKVKEM